MTKLRSIPFLMLLLCAPLAALAAAAAPVRVNIGAASVSSSMLSIWAAQEQGIFAKHGVEAQLILIRGGSTLVGESAHGDVQLAFTSGVSVLGAAAQGVDVKMLTSISSRVSWKLIASPQIKNALKICAANDLVCRVSLAAPGCTRCWPWSSWIRTETGQHLLSADRRCGHYRSFARSRPYRRRGARPAAQPPSHGKGFLGSVDLAKTNASFPGLGVGVTRSYLDQQPTTLEEVVTALTESLAFVQLVANKPAARENSYEAFADDRLGRRRRRLSRSSVHAQSQTLSVARRSAQRAKIDGAAES